MPVSKKPRKKGASLKDAISIHRGYQKLSRFFQVEQTSAVPRLNGRGVLARMVHRLSRS